jgi:hypothetical protein
MEDVCEGGNNGKHGEIATGCIDSRTADGNGISSLRTEEFGLAMSTPDKNPWNDFKTIRSSRRKSSNTPAMLILTILFCGLIGFAIGATTTGFVIMQESDERLFVEGKTRETMAKRHFRWFVLAGGLLGAGSLMGAAWKYWPKDLD